jgi:nucleoside-diphosphate-sugar epimerase
MEAIQQSMTNSDRSQNLSSSTILITGGLGCVGSAISRCLLKRHPQYEVHILDLWIPNETHEIFLPGVQQYHKVDITDYEAISKLTVAVRPHAIFHTAALTPSAAKRLKVGNEGLFKVNVGGTKNVLQAAIDSRCKAFILTSSCDAVKRDSWQDCINLSGKDDDLDSTRHCSDNYPQTKVSDINFINNLIRQLCCNMILQFLG